MNVFLRPVQEKDGHLIVKWRNSPNILRHCMNQNKITLDSNRNFFNDNVKTGKYIQYIVERIEEGTSVVSYPIATVYLKDIDRMNRRCELCIFTSDDEEWNAESQSIAIQMLLKEAFGDLKMHKVYSYVFYKFLDEANLFRSAGFSIEAVFRSEVKSAENEFEDVVRFSVMEDEWSRKYKF